MRIKVVQSIFAHATAGLYGITKSSASIGGYVRAASLGAFDTLGYTVPVLYIGPGMNATLHTHDVLTSASTLRTRKGRAIPEWHPPSPLLDLLWRRQEIALRGAGRRDACHH
jgi:hypothetical protein